MNYMDFSREVKRVRSALNYSSGRPVFSYVCSSKGDDFINCSGGPNFSSANYTTGEYVNDNKCTLQISQGVFGT